VNKYPALSERLWWSIF